MDLALAKHGVHKYRPNIPEKATAALPSPVCNSRRQSRLEPGIYNLDPHILDSCQAHLPANVIPPGQTAIQS